MLYFGLSVRRAIESVLATAALDVYTSDDERPAILNNDCSRALRVIVEDVCRVSHLRLAQALACDIRMENHPDEEEIIYVSFDIEPTKYIFRVFPHMYQSMIGQGVQARVWTGINEERAESYRRAYEDSLEQLAASLRTYKLPARIIPAG